MLKFYFIGIIIYLVFMANPTNPALAMGILFVIVFLMILIKVYLKEPEDYATIEREKREKRENLEAQKYEKYLNEVEPRLNPISEISNDEMRFPFEKWINKEFMEKYSLTKML